MDPRVTEFQCIMPLENIPSVLKLGILSYERATEVPHYSVAMEEIQERRDLKHVPRGLKLHQYANLYFHARNPMLFKRKDTASSLCILCVSVDVINVDGVVVTDRNASSDYVRFLHPLQMRFLDFDAIFATDWRHPGDEIAYYRHRSQKCAEVLVPYYVDPKYLIGAWVINEVVSSKLKSHGFNLPVRVDSKVFFH